MRIGLKQIRSDSPLFRFVFLGPGREVVDFDIATGIVHIVGIEDAAGHPFFESAFAALGFEFLRAATCRLGVGAEVLSAGTIALGRFGAGGVVKTRTGWPQW